MRLAYRGILLIATALVFGGCSSNGSNEASNDGESSAVTIQHHDASADSAEDDHASLLEMIERVDDDAEAMREAEASRAALLEYEAQQEYEAEQLRLQQEEELARQQQQEYERQEQQRMSQRSSRSMPHIYSADSFLNAVFSAEVYNEEGARVYFRHNGLWVEGTMVTGFAPRVIEYDAEGGIIVYNTTASIDLTFMFDFARNMVVSHVEGGSGNHFMKIK